MFLQFGYKMLLDYTDTQDEMDKLAFSLDRVTFTRASSFNAGENVESPTNKTQVGLKSYKLCSPILFLFDSFLSIAKHWVMITSCCIDLYEWVTRKVCIQDDSKWTRAEQISDGLYFAKKFWLKDYLYLQCFILSRGFFTQFLNLFSRLETPAT